MEEITLNDFNGLVYHYGANGTKAIEGLSDAQKEIIYLAWAGSQSIENEEEADKEINSYYKDFLKAGAKVEKKYTGYGYHGGGRPATGIKRVSFVVSCTPKERDQIKAAAEKENKTLSQFVLEKTGIK